MHRSKIALSSINQALPIHTQYRFDNASKYRCQQKKPQSWAQDLCQGGIVQEFDACSNIHSWGFDRERRSITVCKRKIAKTGNYGVASNYTQMLLVVNNVESIAPQGLKIRQCGFYGHIRSLIKNILARDASHGRLNTIIVLEAG